MFEWIPDDWPQLQQFSAAATASVVAGLVLWVVAYVTFRYLVLAPPAPIEGLYARLRPGGVRVGAHTLAGVQKRLGSGP